MILDSLINFTTDFDSNVWRYVVRLIVAMFCGCFIGFERKARSKEAGIRTHAIVCLAAALMMIISKYAFFDLDAVRYPDGSRIASQIVSGIGFLGAGIIVYRRDVMHGLTTAAGIWATAGIGMAIGAGFYVVGICSTLFILILQVVFHLPFKFFSTQHLTVMKVKIWLENDSVINDIRSSLAIKRDIRYEVKNKDDGRVEATLEFATAKAYTIDEINELLAKFPKHLISIERNEEM